MPLIQPKIGFHTGGGGGNLTGIVEDYIAPVLAAGKDIVIVAADTAAGLFDACLEAREVGNTTSALCWRMTDQRPAGGFDFDALGNDFSISPEDNAERHWLAYQTYYPPELTLHDDLVWKIVLNEIRGKPTDEPIFEGLHIGEYLGRFAIHYRAITPDAWKLLFFGFAAGEPELETWQQPAMLEFLDICAARPDDTGIALHEYSYDVTNILQGYPYLIGRYGQLHSVCDVYGIARPTIVISEWGWELDKVQTGAQALIDIDTVMSEYAQHPNILGAAIWWLGPGFGGVADQAQKLIAPVGQHILSTAYDVAIDAPPPDPGSKVVMWSFEDGWIDDPAQPDRRQIPNGFELSVIATGEPLWYGGTATGAVECMHRFNAQMPPNEQIDGPDALILDGDAVFKIQAVSMATGTSLRREVTGTGYKRVTVPVNVHYQEPDSYDREPPLADNDVYVALDIDGVEVDRLTFPDLLDRKWMTLAGIAVAPYTVELRFQTTYANSRDLFTDAWTIEEGGNMATIKKGAHVTHLNDLKNKRVVTFQERKWNPAKDGFDLVKQHDLNITLTDETSQLWVHVEGELIEAEPPPDPKPPSVPVMVRGALGVDVSAWQGQFDWDTAKTNGVQYAIIRSSNGVGSGTTDSDGRDLQLIRNVTECYRLGIPFGLYHFLRADHDIQQQAALVDDILSELEAAQITPLPFAMPSGKTLPPLWIDVEDTKLTNEQIKEFYDTVLIYAGIYTGKSVWDGIMSGVPVWWSGVPLWLAAYGANDGKLPPWTAPFRPVGWESISIWQYTSQGQNIVGLPGLGGLDLNSIGPYPDDGSAPPAPGPTVDMTQYYLPPAGKTYGDISIKSTNWGQGDVRQQLQLHGGYLYVTKGGEIEKRQIVGDKIYFLLDDSPGDGQYYTVWSDTGWIPAQWSPGQTFTRHEVTTFFYKENCQPTGAASDWTNVMLFKELYATWTSPNGIELENVAHLQWIVNGVVEEDYFLAPGLGYAGWKNRWGRESWIKELIPASDQEPNKFSGGCYHAAVG